MTVLIQLLVCPVWRIDQFACQQMLAGQSINDKEVAVASCRQNQLARLSIPRAIDKRRRLCGIEIMRVMRRGLVIPLHLAGFDVQRNQRTCIQVGPGPRFIDV